MRRVNGASSLLHYTRQICRVAGKYGTHAFGIKTTPEMEVAIIALISACHVFEAVDDYPGEIDSSTPFRPAEDVPDGV